MMKGPGIFLAQFMSEQAPLNRFDTACKWAAGLDDCGVQVPLWDARCMDLKKAASSKTYCDELKGIAKNAGVETRELSTHLQGQLVAVHPAYTSMFEVFAPAEVNTAEAMHRYGYFLDQVARRGPPRRVLLVRSEATTGTSSAATSWRLRGDSVASALLQMAKIEI